MERTENVYKELYLRLVQHRAGGKNIFAVVVDGPCAGETIYLSDREVRWVSKEDSIFIDMKNRLGNISGAGLFESEGGRVFYEEIEDRPVLVICGAGHVSIPIIRLGKSIGFYVTVLEDRESFSENARLAGADQVLCEPFASGMEKIQGTRDMYFVIVTRGHRYDTMCLKLALKKEHAYVGMMGSRRRVGIVKEQLLGEGADRKLLEQVHMPVGLPIGAESPEEIAVSVMAEIIQVKNSAGRSEGYTEKVLACLAGEHAESREKEKVLAVIISRKGSAPRKVGTKMVIMEDGTCVGTVGGGYAEEEIKREGLRMIKEKESIRELMTVRMSGKEAEEMGMVCGGTIEVYLEKI